MSLFVPLPWDRQPQEAANVGPQSRLAFSAGSGVSSRGDVVSIVGAPSSTVTQQGRALLLDANTKYLTVTRRGAPFFTGDFCLVWVFRQRASTGGYFLRLGATSGGVNNYLEAYIPGGADFARIDIFTGSGGFVTIDSAAGSITVGSNYVLAFRFKGGVGQWFVNGVPSGSSGTLPGVRNDELTTFNVWGATDVPRHDAAAFFVCDADVNQAEIGRNPWRLFEDRRIFIPIAGAPSGIPTLSAATVFNIAATTARPRVTVTF